jgi:hypothetical protein
MQTQNASENHDLLGDPLQLPAVYVPRAVTSARAIRANALARLSAKGLNPMELQAACLERAIQARDWAAVERISGTMLPYWYPKKVAATVDANGGGFGEPSNAVGGTLAIAWAE